MIRIERDNPGRADVQQLLSEHLADMFATSPAESVHALDSAALSGPDITFWTAREDSEVLGCGALKLLEPGEAGIMQGEIKSMRTAAHARGRGIGALLLTHILAEARRSGLSPLVPRDRKPGLLRSGAAAVPAARIQTFARPLPTTGTIRTAPS